MNSLRSGLNIAHLQQNPATADCPASSGTARAAETQPRSLVEILPGCSGQSVRGATSHCSPLIEIDRNSTLPLHKQVYDGHRAAILRGDLRPGQRVSSSRELARKIKISRFPILQAYAQLLAEGYFESRRGAGTFVARSL